MTAIYDIHFKYIEPGQPQKTSEFPRVYIAESENEALLKFATENAEFLSNYAFEVTSVEETGL